MSEIAQLGVLAGTACNAVSPRLALLLGAAVVVALVACGAGPLAAEVIAGRRARRWERREAGPRPSTGTGPLSPAEAEAWNDITRRLRADGKRRVAPRRRRPARKTTRAGKR